MLEPDPEATRGGLRAATALDLDEVNGVVEAAVESWGLPERVRRLALPSLRYTREDLRHMTVILTDAAHGSAVGMVAWEPIRSRCDAAARSLFLHGIYVTPQWQRRQIGTALLEYVTHAAHALDADAVVLKAWRESAPFFAARGFLPVAGDGDGDTFPRTMRMSVR